MDTHNPATDHAALATLHTRLIDACEGYEEGVKLADEPAMAALFRDLLAMHRRDAEALAAALEQRGVEADPDGSYLQYVHKAILSLRSAFGGLGEGALAGVRDGEGRILEDYDEAIAAESGDPALVAALDRQRQEVAAAVHKLKAMERASEA